MPQNLDLDLSTSQLLKDTDADIHSKSSWTPELATQTTTGTAWVYDGSDGARSYAFGSNSYIAIRTDGDTSSYAYNYTPLLPA